MNQRICYDCIRKTECYTENSVSTLQPGKTYKDYTGYDCGVAFTNYDELREFVYVIGEAINTQGKRTQTKIMQFIADKYDIPLYNVQTEFERCI